MFDSFNQTIIDSERANDHKQDCAILDTYLTMEELEFDINFKDYNDEVILDIDPTCPKCGEIMKFKRMNKDSYMLICDNVSSSCIYPLDDKEIGRYTCNNKDDLKTVIRNVNRYHLDIKNQIDEDWLNLL